MKNLNPASGLRQIVSGYICIPRKIIFELIRDKKIKPSELGYFIILLNSADWDTDIYRKGYIRHEFTKLSTIWDIPCTTLYDYAKTLRDKQLLIVNNGTHKITNFDYFTSKGAQTFVKNKPTDEYLNRVFSKLLGASEISEDNKANDTLHFNVSSKVDFNVYPRRVIIKQDTRTKEEYEKMYKNSNFQCLTPEDMRWIDENVEEKIEIENEIIEKGVIELYFDGNRKKYKNSLIF